METPAQDKLDFKKILPIFVIVLVDLLGLTIIIPLLPLYAVSFGADPLTIGALGTTYPLFQMLAAPLLGGLSDRYGRKPVLIISQIGTFVGFVLLGFANAIPLLFLSRLIDGISGANIVAAQAAITDSTTERTRAQGLGLVGAAFGIGFTLGPAIAGIALALSGSNYHVPAFVAAAFSFVSIMLTSLWFHETLPAEKRGQHQGGGGNILGKIIDGIRNPLVGMLLVLMFLQQLVFGGFEQLLALFTLNRLGLNATGNAVIFVFVGVILVFVQGKYIGPWSRRFGERKLIYTGLGLLAVGLIVTAITPGQAVPWYSRAELQAELDAPERNPTESLAVELPDDSSTGWIGLIWLLAAMIPASVGGGILSPSINSLITRRVLKTEVGGILGVSSALVSTANAITPIIGGAMFQYLGSTAPFLIGGVLMGGFMFIAMQTVKPGPQEQVAASAA
jgi:DHA1 family tetracycline resistance protein-like MFS transporter